MTASVTFVLIDISCSCFSLPDEAKLAGAAFVPVRFASANNR
ncbi:hypothetical protein [Desmonostoc muscorum]|nr:hypothetical protein [Desmonostoc muscorum]